MHLTKALSLVVLGVVVTAHGAARSQDIPGFQYDGEQNWTYDDGALKMKGILIKPAGDGPFPAILISHGKNGNALGFGLSHAKNHFVPMGFVCIAPDYTHAAGASGPPGASAENIARGLKCLEIVRSFPYVQKRRVAAYGHSMGAFVTIAVTAEPQARLRAAGITAGGVIPNPPPGAAYPSTITADKIRKPFGIIHGELDTTVPPWTSQLLKEILDANDVPNFRLVIPDVGHPVNTQKPEIVFPLLEEWFKEHGVLNP